MSMSTELMKQVRGLSDLFTFNLQNDDVQDFDLRRDQAGRIVQVKITGFCSASGGIVFARSRNCSQQWTAELVKIEDICKTSN